MALIHRTQVVDRAVAEVFKVVIDGGSYARWNPTIRASRRLDDGALGEGSSFEWDLRGFGRVIQELREFERNSRVRIVPQIKAFQGGHRSLFTPQGDSTAPVMGVIGRKNLRDTANALQAHLENPSPPVA